MEMFLAICAFGVGYAIGHLVYNYNKEKLNHEGVFAELTPSCGLFISLYNFKTKLKSGELPKPTLPHPGQGQVMLCTLMCNQLTPNPIRYTIYIQRYTKYRFTAIGEIKTYHNYNTLEGTEETKELHFILELKQNYQEDKFLNALLIQLENKLRED